jgi:hypothetical protein
VPIIHEAFAQIRHENDAMEFYATFIPHHRLRNRSTV